MPKAATVAPRLAAVVVTYNRLPMLQRALPRLLDQSLERVIVVDNATTDGTAAWLASQHDPRLMVVTLPENSGGAGGFEAGMARLVAQDNPDWIVLLDDDAWPEPGALQRFVETAPSLPAATGAVVAAVRLPNGQISEMNRPGYNPFWHGRKIWATLARGSRAGFKLPDSAYAATVPLVEIDNGSFVGYFVARAGWQKAGLPEGGLFIYGDDVLYSLRLRRAGLKVVFDPGLWFTHDCGSMDAHFVYRPLWKIYYHCRNGVAIAWAAAGPLVFPVALGWYILVWARRGRRCPMPERSLYWRMMWTGIRDGLLCRRGRVDAVHHMAAPVAAQNAD
jgi:rhamnopyranosyl-N-acetylglucosaminyl-diphospho-decaprenol beta-1,3/1,4-galactofuranosyltransferase